MNTTLEILPLGGCAQVGLNATIIAHQKKAILIDCGIEFVDDVKQTLRRVPDLAPFLNGEFELQAVVVTHGHEDHIGALPFLLRRFPVPVYGTETTLAFIRSRFEREGDSAWLFENVLLQVMPYRRSFTIADFNIEAVRVTHSIPEAAALYIEVKGRSLLHTGDYCLEPDPIDGQRTDLERLKEIGDKGVDLLLSDSTNSEVKTPRRSERVVQESLKRLVLGAENRVFVSVLSSHLHRIQSVFEAAEHAGRQVAVFGLSLDRTVRLGIEQGHIKYTPRTRVSIEDAERKRKDQMVWLLTGTQGENNAGLFKLASAIDTRLPLSQNDRVIVSARAIPGRELAIRSIENDLRRRGAEVIRDRHDTVHCSGHAHIEEQSEMLKVLRPKAFMPIHGDYTMLECHAATARAMGISEVYLIENGTKLVHQGSFRKVSGYVLKPALLEEDPKPPRLRHKKKSTF